MLIGEGMIQKLITIPLLTTLLVAELPDSLLKYVTSVIDLDREYQQMSFFQHSILLEAYLLGEVVGLKWTLPAVAWKESSAGLVLENLKDPSYGYFGILLATAENRVKNIDSDLVGEECRDELIFLLQTDIAFGAEFAIQEIKYWSKLRKSWPERWAAYNGGFRYKRPAPQVYAQEIKNRITILRKYMKQY